MRRDSSANGSLGLFFGPVLGKSTTDLTAVAAATIYTATANGFKNVSGFRAGLLPVTYDVAKQTLNCNGVTVLLKPVDGKVRLRLLIDRGSIEAFGNDGAVAVSAAALAPEGRNGHEVFSRGGPTRVLTLEVI